MEKSKMTTKKSVLIIIGTLFAFLVLALIVRSALRSADRSGEISFFLENDRGTYNLVELSVPEGEGPYPVVLMAHGFAGTLHSGGATELGDRLAKEGVLAVRVDFDPYTKPDKKAEQTHDYPQSQMIDDAVNVLDEVMKKYNGDPDDVSLYGRSYGGRLVMHMANESSGGYDYQKLALVAPAGDAIAFTRYLGGTEQYKAMKEEANGEKGYADKLGIHITPQWFKDVEDYDPCEFGWKFGDKPVLLFYNTLDTVVYPDTSIRCANAYKNHEIVEVTTEDSHGYEMGYRQSELKDQIMDQLVEFLS